MNTIRNIFVTGGSGRIGKYIVRSLVERHFTVISYDKKLPNERLKQVTYLTGDINDLASLRQNIEGIDAVVHLAAIPDPEHDEPHKVMEINVMGTFKVFQAAAEKRVKKVIQASSINALGAGYGLGRFNVRYLPIDEDHPSSLSDPYSLSKKIVEEIGEYFWKSHALPSISFRFPAVYFLEYIQPVTEAHREKLNKALDFLEQLDDITRNDYFESLFKNFPSRKKFFNYCYSNFENLNEEEKTERFSAFLAYRILREFCSYIHIFDCVDFIISALIKDFDGATTLFINGPDNGGICETSRLIRIFFPLVKDIRQEFKSNEPLINSKRAETILSYQAKRSIECF